MKLPAPDNFHLRAAEGWLELGNHLEADRELEEIAPELRAHPDVLELRWHIYAIEEKWAACVAIAEAIILISPNRPDAWIHRSFALHEMIALRKRLINSCRWRTGSRRCGRSLAI